MTALAGAALLVAAVLGAGHVVGGYGGGRDGIVIASGSATPLVTSPAVQSTQQQEEVGDAEGNRAVRAVFRGVEGAAYESEVVQGGWHSVRTTQVAPIRDLALGERVRILTLAQWRAIHASGGPEEPLARIGWCESGLDVAAVGAAGEQGVWQVLARFHGPVPPTRAGQAAQAARIMVAQGEVPWMGRSCEEWTR